MLNLIHFLVGQIWCKEQFNSLHFLLCFAAHSLTHIWEGKGPFFKNLYFEASETKN